MLPEHKTREGVCPTCGDPNYFKAHASGEVLHGCRQGHWMAIHPPGSKPALELIASISEAA